MLRSLLAALVVLTSCSDTSTRDQLPTMSAPQDSRAIAALDSFLVDGSLQDIHVVRIWDASLEGDNDVDSTPPEVCERYGQTEPCHIPIHMGPCAEGRRICYVTHWTDCNPSFFPRAEICDGIDNDCDGQLNEAPNNIGADHQNPQNNTLSIACYTVTLGSL